MINRFVLSLVQELKARNEQLVPEVVRQDRDHSNEPVYQLGISDAVWDTATSSNEA